MHKNIILERPIVFLDFETTGTSVTEDRIVQVACIKIFPDGTRETKSTLICPVNYTADGNKTQVLISPGATEVHGITDEMVKDKPTFRQLSKSMYAFLDDSDIGGYNSNRFDVLILAEEFKRVGMDFDLDKRSYIDVLKLEMTLAPRTLGAVYKRYIGEELEDAHDALADTEATVDIFLAQVEKFDLKGAVEDIDSFSQGENKRVDLAGKLAYDEDGNICWTFGKHKGKPVKNDRRYLSWFLGTDVPTQTRKILQNI